MRLRGSGILLEHIVVILVRLAQHHGDALFDDACFLGSDLAQRIAQQLRMLHPHVGHHAQKGRYDVGGVQTAAQTRLDHGHLDLAVGEVVERHSRRRLEERKVELAHLGLMLIDEIHHLLFGDHLAVDAYALAKILQVRRRVESHAIPRLLEHRSQNVRHRPFAVGARHMNGVIVTLRIAQMTTKLDYALRPGFVGIGPHMLERGH